MNSHSDLTGTHSTAPAISVDSNNTNMTPGNWPAVSICIITLEHRLAAFTKLLQYLAISIDHYAGDCELIICNNSAATAEPLIRQVIETSPLGAACPCHISTSPKNNIATGRNRVLANASHDIVAFIDDDEYPEKQWLEALVEVMQQTQCGVVAGPVHAVFSDDTVWWIKATDLHNTNGLADHDRINMTGSGNVLMDTRQTGTFVFNEEFGKTGGSDTEYFLRLHDAGIDMRWAIHAVAHEDIPADRSTARYLIKRFRIQGTNYRRVMSERGAITSNLGFTLKAVLVSMISAPVGLILWLIRHPSAGNWIKRCCSNIGKIYRPPDRLYD